jgi:hypothetical protein
MRNHKVVPIEYLHQCFDADFETGTLTWRTRPREHFKIERAWKAWNATWAGKPAGSINCNTHHRTIYLTSGGGPIFAHRVLWAMAYGSWPKNQIDHIDGNPSNNQLKNLREAVTGSEQQQNQKRNARNRSGYPGVSWHKGAGNWQAYITVARRNYHLGYFADRTDAFIARCTAKIRMHPYQPFDRDVTRWQADLHRIAKVRHEWAVAHSQEEMNQKGKRK